MGLIKSALSSALGSDQVKTGFTGPQLPFQNGRGSGVRNNNAPTYGPPPSYDSIAYQESLASCSDEEDISDYQNYGRPGDRKSQRSQGQAQYSQTRRSRSRIPYAQPRAQYTHGSMRTRRQRSSMRPLALPQIAHGDGQPFLRAYSEELGYRGISLDVFINVLDRINVAIIPNPEVQIFQKGASIAGWFVPGAASLGLMGGQIVVGIGNALGYASSVNAVLSRANLEIFLPCGLEICIGKAKNINEEVDAYPDTSYGIQNTSPEMKVAAYGDLLAPLDVVLAPATNQGRRDPIAMLGRGIANRDSDRKASKAQKKMDKGKSKKSDALEGGLKWLMVREATPDTLAHWQRIQAESDAALRQQQAEGAQSSVPARDRRY